ncbi:hypothetical protein [Xylophilus sp. GOD-11R]|uniref:hypothetical protein n=1 Tax=Xylophilus sp. GOD-11R TaxID=3089814 RepID=UPI00298D14BA|nr:hypothetical protein [Xylophilus sp. GOD-11R]WPB58030.1 hypothetical protein R9X41_05150 [Xylophilus sp. GOD-11R]
MRTIATAAYIPPGQFQSESVISNPVDATVSPVEAMLLTNSQEVIRPPGSGVLLSHLLTNTGNVASTYRLDLQTAAASCSNTASLGAVKLVRDTNSNGVQDGADTVLNLSPPSTITLQPAESTALLVIAEVPRISDGMACLRLTATSTLQNISASNVDAITIGHGAVMVLTKSAYHDGPVIAGKTVAHFDIQATNIGGENAQAVGRSAPALRPVIVDGLPSEMLLLRDVLPRGTHYVPESLQTSTANAVRLYRRPGDPELSYRTVEDRDAIEVAIGLNSSVAPAASIAMQFDALVSQNAPTTIVNLGQSYFFDGAANVESASNPVVLAVGKGLIGIAKESNVPSVDSDQLGKLTSVLNIQFKIKVKNYSDGWLYNVQAIDVMEGLESNQFGRFTASATPGEGEYTIVPGSVRVVSGEGVSANGEFNGTSSRKNLFLSGGKLAPDAMAVVQFDVRVNSLGRIAGIENTATAVASILGGSDGSSDVQDESVDGQDPDPDGDGNPNNNASSTLVQTKVAHLKIKKSASLPRRIDLGVYELDYVIRVENDGSISAPNIRVVDNLSCTFPGQEAGGHVSSWSLVGAPIMRNNILAGSAGFTGRASCNQQQIASSDPRNFPSDLSLILTDGNRPLAPGQVEEVAFTVRLVMNDDAAQARTAISNKAWVASLKENVVATNPTLVIAATAATATALVVDPQGIVYDAGSRKAIAGALVTYVRRSCPLGLAGPIVPDEIYGGESGNYVFNENGSVSMTTGSSGAYQFFLKSPPISSVCNYEISVKPPAGSAYVSPSQLIAAAPGTFSRCGAVVSNVNAPAEKDSTEYFNSVASGVYSTGRLCEVFNNHIPLDPGNVRGLVLRKEASKRQVELGDFLEYALTLINKTGSPINGFEFIDKLPIGFAYVPGSASLDGRISNNPLGGSGPDLKFVQSSTPLNPDAQTILRYRVRVGVGAANNAEAINRASAQAGPIASNSASASVRVAGGVLSDEAFAFGKVYLDCRRDGQQDDEHDVGVPGVRLFLENGTFVVTDGEGKWSLYGLKPVTHVVRVDQSTLPRGARLEILDNRNAGNPASRFLDLAKGELNKADFPIENCDDQSLVAEVKARRTAVALNGTFDGEAQMRARLDPEGRRVSSTDSKALPASGQSSGIGAFQNTGAFAAAAVPLIALPVPTVNTSVGRFVGGLSGNGTLGIGSSGAGSLPGSVFPPMGQAGLPTALAQTGNPVGAALPANAPSRTSAALDKALVAQEMNKGKASLGDLLSTVTDASLGFLDLRDHETLTQQSVNVSVKGPLGSNLGLRLNGDLVGESRIGKKATLETKSVEGWEYVGVLLKPGVNTLNLRATDQFGNERGDGETISVTAPDTMSAIELSIPATARADLRTPIVIRVQLLDSSGLRVGARTQLTLEADRGRWIDEDLNPKEPGVQVFMEGGQAEFRILPPAEPGTLRIRVSAGPLVKEAMVSLLAELRPMIGVGIVEGVLDFSKRGHLPIGAVPAGAAFESELSNLGGSDGGMRLGARSAFFLKGAVKGEYLLTASFDSDKRHKDRLFRDIRPDDFYPIYGDSSVRGFDAQSTQRLYVRVDKNRSYLLYGDFSTTSSSEVRSLSQTNRTLTGLRHVYDDKDLRASSYVSNTSQTQQVEEFRALGTSGPYYLSASGGEFVDNSEQIEIVVRDRNQPNIVLQRTPVTRFVDYTVEALTRRILFTRPISSVDGAMNPQSIRVTYEVENGGENFVVAGTDVQFRPVDNLQLGVVVNTDRNPANRRDMAALTALARLGESTTLAAEIVRTQSDEKQNGAAARAEIRYQHEDVAAVALASKTSTGFDNPGATTSAGRSDLSARMEYRVDPSLSVRGEALYSKDAATEQNRAGASLTVQKKVNETFTVEGGLRYGQTNASLGSVSGFDYGSTSTYNGSFGGTLGAGNTTALGALATNTDSLNEHLTTVRARVITKVPGIQNAQAFVEAEQSVNDGDRHNFAVGANYALTNKTRAYGRYELISSLYGPFEAGDSRVNNTGILGIESAYMDGGRIYNEYRLANSIDGRAAVAALGVRNTYSLTPRIRVTGGVEHTRNLSSASNSVNNGTGHASLLGESTAVTGGVEYLLDQLKASAILEGRNGSDSDTLLFSGGVAYKVNPEISLLARSVFSDSKGQGSSSGNERRLHRHQIGVAYRPVDSNKWNALARYEHKAEEIVGSGISSGAAIGANFSGATLPGKYLTDIFSTHVNFNPQRGTYLSSRYAAKVSHADDGNLASRYWAQLLHGRITHDLGRDWDIGLQAGVLRGHGGAAQKTWGAEVGYQVYRDIWLSGGYNFIGLTDRDLAANEYISEGPYLRMRMKFDETSLGFASVDSSVAADPVAGVAVVPESRVRDTDAPALEISSRLGHGVEADQTESTVLDSDSIFDEGSANLKAGSLATLDIFATRVEGLPTDAVLRIIDKDMGRPSAKWDLQKNKELMAARAKRLKTYLASRGVATQRIQTDGPSEKPTGLVNGRETETFWVLRVQGVDSQVSQLH